MELCHLWCFDWGKRFTYNAWNITPFDLMYFLWFSYCDASWSVEYEAIDLMQHVLNQWFSAGFALDINTKQTILPSNGCICSSNVLIGCTCLSWYVCLFCYLKCAWLCMISCTSLFTLMLLCTTLLFWIATMSLLTIAFCFYVMCLWQRSVLLRQALVFL